jgi:hypothetical protein
LANTSSGSATRAGARRPHRGRYRKVAHSFIRRVVELARLSVDPWPPAPKNRNRPKAVKKRVDVDVRRLPDIDGMTPIITGIRSDQPGSRKYEVMTAVMYFAGLTSSEVVMLRPRALALPNVGGERSNWDRALKRGLCERERAADARLRLPPRLRHAMAPGRVPMGETAR